MKTRYGHFLVSIGLAGLILNICGCASTSMRMWNACRKGDAATVSKLIAEGYSFTNSVDHGYADLGAAINHGDIDIVKQLLDAGAAASNQCLTTPAGRGDISMLKILFAHGCDQNKQRLTDALREAVKSEKLECVQLLVKRGADVNQQMDAFVVKSVALAKSGNPVYALGITSGSGNNALSLAIMARNARIVTYLLAHGGDAHRRVVYKDAQIKGAPEFPGDVYMTVGNQRLFVIFRQPVTLTNFPVEKQEVATILQLARKYGGALVLDAVSKALRTH